MELTENDGAFIPLEEAKKMVSNYKNNSIPNPDNVVNSHYFGKNKLLAVINQPNSIGARFYHGKAANEDGILVQQIIVVGVDKDENDILDTDRILDISTPCPPYCPPPDKGL